MFIRLSAGQFSGECAVEEIADRPKRTERKIKNAGCPEIIESESSFAISTVNFAVSMTKSTFQIITDTVDGSEIPLSPLEVGSCSHYLLRFFHPRWLSRRISEPSTAAGKSRSLPKQGIFCHV